MMSLHERFIVIAKLLGGSTDRWQAAAGAKLEISRGHMHHLVTGARPVTQQMVVKAIDAARAEAAVLRARADELDGVLAQLMPAGDEPVPPMSDEEYQRQAAESERIIEELTFGSFEENDSEV